MDILHITNGDSVAETLRLTNLGGEVLPWRDVLHEGPVPADLSPAALNEVRARYMADCGWGELDVIRRSFAERDAVVERWGLHAGSESRRVVLWFEHDLYDQLQLLQVLDRLSRLPFAATSLDLVMIDDHPDVERFIGLGQLGPEQLSELYSERQPVTPEQLQVARTTWEVFRRPTPGTLYYYSRDIPCLPFLGAALRRHIEQLPSMENGLGRTEQQALEALASGSCRAADLFAAQYTQEEIPFLGDSTFWDYLERLANPEVPLVKIAAAEPFGEALVTITDAGAEVLRGDADHIALNGADRWYGGLHLEGRQDLWRRSRDGRLHRDLDGCHLDDGP